MQKIRLILQCCILSFSLFAQEKDTLVEIAPLKEEKIYDFVEEFPILKGSDCDTLLNEHYRQACSKRKLSSIFFKEIKLSHIDKNDRLAHIKTTISFIISREGKMKNIEIIRTKNPHNMVDQALLEAINRIAKKYEWIAGKQNGESVSVRMIIPIHLNLR